jgi:hypothetical protein
MTLPVGLKGGIAGRRRAADSGLRSTGLILPAAHAPTRRNLTPACAFNSATAFRLSDQKEK